MGQTASVGNSDSYTVFEYELNRGTLTKNKLKALRVEAVKEKLYLLDYVALLATDHPRGEQLAELIQKHYPEKWGAELDPEAEDYRGELYPVADWGDYLKTHLDCQRLEFIYGAYLCQIVLDCTKTCTPADAEAAMKAYTAENDKLSGMEAAVKMLNPEPLPEAVEWWFQEHLNQKAVKEARAPVA